MFVSLAYGDVNEEQISEIEVKRNKRWKEKKWRERWRKRRRGEVDGSRRI